MSKPARLEISTLPFALEEGSTDTNSALPARLPEESALSAPVARPTNYARSAFHVLSGVASLALLRLLPGRAWLIAASGAFLVTAWTMETLRKRSPAANEKMLRLLGVFAHPHERHRVNSSTWYITALFLLALAAPLKAAELGVLVLAAADPAAGFVGRRFGRTRLRAGRSLEGSLAFLTVGALVGIAWLSIVHAAAFAASWSSMAIIAGAGALAGALAELFSTKLDDNFTIPVATSAAAAVAEIVLAALRG